MSRDIFRVGVRVRVKKTRAVGFVVDVPDNDASVVVRFGTGNTKRFSLRDLERLHWLEGGTFFGDER